MIRPPTHPAVLASAALGALLLAGPAPAQAQQPPLRIIVFGAHPDDCDKDAGGTAALWAARGHAVKFVALTNGDAGHQTEGGGALAKRRRAEAQEAGRRYGIAEYEVLDNHDGELEPTLAVRQQVIRRIRQWQADLVIAPRPNDYHPDHRYTGVVVQDSAYMVVVPNVTPDTPPLRKNPVFMYGYDRFQRPNPFRPDVAVAIDSVDRQEDPRARRARVADVRVAALGRRDPRQRAEGAGRATCLAARAAQRKADRRRRARRAAQVVRRPRRRRQGRRGLRGLRVRPPAERVRPAAALSVLRLTPRPGGPGARRQSAPGGRQRREVTPWILHRRHARLCRPLAVIYTDTAPPGEILFTEAAVATLPAALRGRLEPHGTVTFTGRPMRSPD